MFNGDNVTMSIKVKLKESSNFGITDMSLLGDVFNDEQLEVYRTVRGFMNNIGFDLEDYLYWKCKNLEGYNFVGRKKKRLKQTDFIIYEERWSIKNSKSSENSTTRDYRENYVGVTKHWCRVNVDGSYNWDTCPIPNCSEEEFRAFIGIEKSNLLLSPLMNCF